jgi:hypothetical protein
VPSSRTPDPDLAFASALESRVEPFNTAPQRTAIASPTRNMRGRKKKNATSSKRNGYRTENTYSLVCFLSLGHHIVVPLHLHHSPGGIHTGQSNDVIH